MFTYKGNCFHFVRIGFIIFILHYIYYIYNESDFCVKESNCKVLLDKNRKEYGMGIGLG